MVNMNVTDLLITIIETLIMEYLLFDRSIKHDKKSWLNIIIYCFFMATCIRIITIFQVTVPLKVIIILFLITFIGSKANKRTLKSGALLGTIFMITNSMCEIFATGIIHFITNFEQNLSAPTIYHLMAVVIAKLTLLIIIMILTKFLDKTIHNIIYGNWMIIILPNLLNLTFSIIIGYRIYYTKYIERVETAILLFIIFMILVSTLCFIVTSEYYVQMKEIEHKNKVNMAQIKLQYEYFRNKQEDDLKLRELYHDMKNHLLVLQNNLENDQKQNYIKSILKEVKVIDSYIDTGNDFLNSIINEKYKEATAKGIDFNVQIDFSEISFMAPMDICTIFSNALDNAIEACEKNNNLEQKVMSVKARKIRNFLTITFENSSTENLMMENDEIISTKQDKLYHGFGLKNIRKIVEKYQGECKIKKDLEQFILYLVIPCSV
ncbi:sensor histidine kinase YesM [Mobilisporobacter senegalensis]|uniref:Sensor histidine kinase YesM n=1 Tax=Mobilisporobacter senegalensis TaxID=1329262 RepID=A0A3N1XW22_9FIRM|nr:sensor histidine kinase [Mobilisporobacter senegalensis]ROR29127.1 sensor histidine kinase YesM [Mobilisporobacter senegalensis]